MRISFFILTVLVIPFLPSGATIPRWAFLSLLAAVLVFNIELSLTVWLLIGYVGLMAWIAPVGYESTLLYWHFLIFVVLFCYAQKHDIVDSVIKGCWAAMTLNSAVVIAQYFGWKALPALTPESGLFFNHNLGSEAAAMVFVMLAYQKRYLWLLTLVPTLWFGSRAPIEGIAICLLIMLWKDRFIAVMAFLACQLVVFGQWAQPDSAWQSAAGITPFMETMNFRWGVWLDTLSGLSFFGHGLGSFMIDFPTLQAHSNPLIIRYENPHNDMLQIVYEFGVGGMILIGLLLWRMGKVQPNVAWYGLTAFLVEGFFDFPLYAPVTGALAAVCAGSLFSDRVAVRSLFHAVRRGIQNRPGYLASPAFRAIGKTISPHEDAPFRPSLSCGQDGGRMGRPCYPTGT